MSTLTNFLAVDLGASSGRVLIGHWDGSRFSLEELHRFSNGGVSVLGNMHWDVLRLWSEIGDALTKYCVHHNELPAGISVDSWGVDFGLLDSSGSLIGNPFHYRDSRTNGIPELVMQSVSAREIYQQTAIQTLHFNTLFQLYSMVRSRSQQLKSARTLLMIPDLFHYFLSGEIAIEYTNATTSQMYSPQARNWAHALLERLDIPTGILPRIVQPGTVLGQVRAEVCRAAGFASTFPVIAGTTHDTASAVAGIPNLEAESVFLSSGTWSLMGVEVDRPVTSNEAFELNYTNEGGAAGTIRLLKNVTGLWLLQECHRQWSREGHHLEWSAIMRLAEAAEPQHSFIEPDDPAFRAPMNMVDALHEYCRATGQRIPGSVGQLARTCLESLCVKYRIVLEQLRSITGRRLDTIRVVGGGSQNRLLCQWTADACECNVVAGPVEASALGNVMMQAVATGLIKDVKSGREAIGRSVACERYTPGNFEPWIGAIARFRELGAPRVV
jgi:rhamnulokinase